MIARMEIFYSLKTIWKKLRCLFDYWIKMFDAKDWIVKVPISMKRNPFDFEFESTLKDDSLRCNAFGKQT